MVYLNCSIMNNIDDRYTNLDGYNSFSVAINELRSEKVFLWYRQQILTAVDVSDKRAKADVSLLWGWMVQALIIIGSGALRGAKLSAEAIAEHSRDINPQAWDKAATLLREITQLFSDRCEDQGHCLILKQGNAEASDEIVGRNLGNIYEGTWEEIASHASELTGRRVRLTVLDLISDEEKTPPGYPLAEALKEKVGIIEGASPGLSTQTGEKFTEFLHWTLDKLSEARQALILSRRGIMYSLRRVVYYPP